MKSSTVQQLNQLNKNFYEQQAQSWQSSREYFWPSWFKFWELSGLKQLTSLSILDVGCGTGRFGQFIDEQLHKPPNSHNSFLYEGWDFANSLLKIAQAKSEKWSNCSQVSWAEVDLLSNVSRPDRHYQVVACFGVLHHLPGKMNRQNLIAQLADLVDQQGEFWLTTWNPLRAGATEPTLFDSPASIDSADLESGDVFLGWKNTAARRYLHWLTVEEEKQINHHLRDKGFKLKASWAEDSPGESGNLCWLWQKV